MFKKETIMKISKCSLVAAGFLLIAAKTAVAAAISYPFAPTQNQCDDPPQILLTEELGDVASAVFPFSGDDSIRVAISQANPNLAPACVSDNGMQDDWIISITNAGQTTFRDLHFVSDESVSLSNADQRPAGGEGNDAFRIDSIGINANLLSESIAADELFSPGESWDFVVWDFNVAGQPDQPVLGSGGIGQPDPSSNASIVGIPVPEPSGLSLSILSVVGMFLFRLRK